MHPAMHARILRINYMQVKMVEITTAAMWFAGWTTFQLLSSHTGFDQGELALTTITLTYGVGVILAFAMWVTGMRAWPSIGSAEIITSIKASVLLTASHILTVYSMLPTTSAVDAIQFKMSSGTFDGVIKLYGIS